MSASSIVYRLSNIRSKQPWIVLSAAQDFSLAESDHSSISHFYSFEANASSEATFAIPDGCVDILFDCDSSQPSARVFGTPMEAIDTEFKSHHRYFGVRFAPGVVPDFLDVSAKELIEHQYGFLEVFSHGNQLLEEIVSSASFSEQVALFKQFYHGKEARKRSALTSQAIQCIYDRKGNVKVKALEELTGYTSRTLQRQFQDDVGLSPKAFSRIVRCQSAVYDINHKEKVVFSDLAFDLGFSDQPHFLHEFKKLIHATPMHYQSRVKDKTYLERIRYC